MSKRYPGNFITGNPVALSQTSNNGIWDLKDNYTATNNNVWQEGDSGYYEVQKSLRLRNSVRGYVSRYYSTAGSATTFTWSGWVKRSKLGQRGGLFTGVDSVGSIYWGMEFSANDTITVYDSTVTTGTCLQTTRVFRDTSAWYHIVVAVDTTQAVAANRTKIYINGIQETSFGAINYPAQNTATKLYVGGGGYVSIGEWGNPYPTTLSLDGYITEVNFIDGQALDSSYFGYFYPITNIWQPKPYTGGYGAAGAYLPFKSDGDSYQALFNGTSQYLTVPDNAAFDFGSGDFTVECWFYRTGGGGRTGQVVLNQSVSSATSNSAFYFGAGNDGMSLYLSTTGTSWTNNIETGVAPASGIWQHCVWQRRNNTLEIYLNGKLQTPVSGTAAFSGTINNSSRNVEIGTQNGTSLLTGYLSNLRAIKGRAVYTQNFVPQFGPLTSTSDTSLLTCQNATFVDNSSIGSTITNVNSVTLGYGSPWISADGSGNGNNWTTNAIIQTPGLTYDIMVDSPTNVMTTATDTGGVVSGNYCTINSAFLPPGHNSTAPYTTDSGGATTTEANLTIYRTQNANYAFGTMPFPAAGKWYWEYTIRGGTRTGFGITNNIRKYSSGGGDMNTTGDYGFQWEGGQTKITNGSPTSAGSYFSSVPTTNDIIGCAYDADNGTMYFSKNGTWGNSGNPATGTNPLITGIPTSSITGIFVPVWAGGGDYPSSATLQGSFNFGQRAFNTAPPSGFKSLNTTNIQALGTSAVGKAAIQPHKWFDISLYGGTGITRSIVNSGFQPDLLWLKSRSSTAFHSIWNSVTPNLGLSSNSTMSEQESGAASDLISLNSDGFTVGPNSNWASTNGAGLSIVAWQWKQSPTSGLNIISYTGDGVLARSISHNLGVEPSMIFYKRRSGTAQDWGVYHKSMGLKLMQLNTASTYWNGASNYWYSAPTSSVFYPDTTNGDHYQNTNGVSYIAYLWAEVPGFSKFGSYLGNGSTDGAFIYTGFRPKYILYKAGTGSAYNWGVYDTSRDPTNIASRNISPNATDVDSTYAYFDILSNGFKCRGGAGNNNENGATYIYAAFAESPFALNNRAR